MILYVISAKPTLTLVKIKSQIEAKGGIYLTNPVFGQPPAALARQLVVVSSGDKRGRERLLPIFEYIGKKVIDVGDDNAKGTISTLSFPPDPSPRSTR